MPLSGLIAIQSVRFPQAFLRMDGSQVTSPQGGGSGIVNCQFYLPNTFPDPSPGNLEVFEIIEIPSVPNNGYGIRSHVYPHAFLRIDGSNVNSFQGGGSGTVNCQYYAGNGVPVNGDYESLIVGPLLISGDPVYCVATGFQGVFLRIDGSRVTSFQGAGSGTVNCQYYSSGDPSSLGDYEVFNIISL